MVGAPWRRTRQPRPPARRSRGATDAATAPSSCCRRASARSTSPHLTRTHAQPRPLQRQPTPDREPKPTATRPASTRSISPRGCATLRPHGCSCSPRPSCGAPQSRRATAPRQHRAAQHRAAPRRTAPHRAAPRQHRAAPRRAAPHRAATPPRRRDAPLPLDGGVCPQRGVRAAREGCDPLLRRCFADLNALPTCRLPPTASPPSTCCHARAPRTGHLAQARARRCR